MNLLPDWFPQELRAEGSLSDVEALVRVTQPMRTRYLLDRRRTYYHGYSIYHPPRADSYGYAAPPRRVTGLLARRQPPAKGAGRGAGTYVKTLASPPHIPVFI